MRHEYVVVSVSQNAISEDYKDEIRKLFKDFNLAIIEEENKATKFSNIFSVSFSYHFFELELLDIRLKLLSSAYSIDLATIPKSIYAMKKKLVVFDMDSTLITAEVIDEMAHAYGVGEKVKKITSRAMNGEINFDESLRERVSLLAGFKTEQMESIIKNLQLTPGTKEFCHELRLQGVKMAIASGGFDYFAQHVQKILGIDYVYSNKLEVTNNVLTGKTSGTIINAEKKSQIIEELASKENITLNEIVAIGDGANDIPMLLKAGLGIAIHAKEKVQKAAHYRINHGPMTHALNFMGHETL